MKSPNVTFSERFHFKRHGLLIKAMKAGLSMMTMRETKVLLGEDAVEKLVAEVASEGITRPLIVTTAGAVKRGQIDSLKEALENQGIGSAVFSDVTPDPVFSMVTQGVDMQQRSQCDAVIAFGGGSPMDAAKAIAVAATNGDKSIVKLMGVRKGKNQPLPLYAVPTTSGTASEVSNVAVISTDNSHQKQFMIDTRTIARAAALDPTLTASLPPATTAETGMDAMTHAFEAYMSTIASEETDGFAVEAIRDIFAYLPVAFKDGENLEARQAMAVASLTAGKAFRSALLGYVHAISHQLGALYGVPHGLGNAILLPHILEYSRPAVMDKLAQLAVTLGLGEVSESVEKLSQKLVDKVWQLNKELQISEKVPGLKAGDIPAIADKAQIEAMSNYPVPRYMGRKDIEQLLEKLL